MAEYRLEYMKRLNQKTLEGIDSATYTHYLAFIDKLDHAAEQVRIAKVQSQALVEQCKGLWLSQMQKVNAVEHLRNKQLQKVAKKEQKDEQKMFDEIAIQQFVRRTF